MAEGPAVETGPQWRHAGEYAWLAQGCFSVPVNLFSRGVEIPAKTPMTMDTRIAFQRDSQPPTAG